MRHASRLAAASTLSIALTIVCLVTAAMLGFMGALVTASAATTMAGESVIGSPNLSGGVLPPTHATCNGSVVNVGYQVINQPATAPPPASSTSPAARRLSARACANRDQLMANGLPLSGVTWLAVPARTLAGAGAPSVRKETTYSDTNS